MILFTMILENTFNFNILFSVKHLIKLTKHLCNIEKLIKISLRQTISLFKALSNKTLLLKIFIFNNEIVKYTLKVYFNKIYIFEKPCIINIYFKIYKFIYSE